MSRRSEYLAALRREPTQTLTWAPNFDHWLAVNRANDTVPEEYRGMSGNEIIRAVGGTIWRRVTIVHAELDPSVTIDTESPREDVLITNYRTPVGDLRTVEYQAPDSSHTWFLKEHRVKSVEDLEPLRYLYEATQYHLDTREYEREAVEVGEDGIVLTCLPPVPFIAFAKTEVGYERAYYLMLDYPKETEAVIAAMWETHLRAYRLAAQGPCEVVSNGDNMDQWTCPPSYFKRYAAPFYQEVRKILHAGGKLAQGHWCGRTDQLIPLMPTCGLDIIEAMVSKPMSETDMAVAMRELEGKVTVQGGLPSIYMCEEGCTRDELVRYVEDLLDEIGNCTGFVLGMADNVPSNADFPRVKMVSEVVEAFNMRRGR